MIGDNRSALVFLLVTLALPFCQTDSTTVSSVPVTTSRTVNNVTDIAADANISNTIGDDLNSSFSSATDGKGITPSSSYNDSMPLGATGGGAPVDPNSTAATTEQAVNQSDAIQATEQPTSPDPSINSPPPPSTFDSITTESTTNSANSSAKNETAIDSSENAEQPSSTHNPLFDELTSVLSLNASETNVSTNSPLLVLSNSSESVTSSNLSDVTEKSFSSETNTVDPEEKNNATFISTPFTDQILENVSISENFTSIPPPAFNISTLTNSTLTDITSNGTFSGIIHDNNANNNSNSETGDDNITSSWLNSSVSVPPNSSTDFVEDENVSPPTTEVVFPEEPEGLSPLPSVQPWFLLQFVGNCTMAQEEFDQFEKDVRNQLITPAGVPENNVSINMSNCSKNFLLNITVSPEYANSLREFFKKLLFQNDSKVQFNEEIYYMKFLGSTNSNEHKQPPEIVLSSRHTDIEFVIYVALGSACAFLLVLAVLLIMCKYCRTKPYKGFDVSEVGNLNLRLEDYTLTRIPRPKSIYTEYCRSTSNDLERYCPLDEQSSQANGMVHPFDTSVVPLEDAPPAKVDNDSDDRAQGAAKTNPSNHEYEEIDVNSVNSTENLHERKSGPPTKPPWGVDNASFAT